MKRIIITVCLVLAGNVGLAADKHDAIPPKYHGYWVTDLKYCDETHLYNLTIDSNSVQYWESRGPAVSVVTQGDNKLALIAELSGEGEKWITFIHFRLSSDKSNLTDISDPYSKSQLVRYRCPNK